MAEFQYIAINKDGKEIKGNMQANDMQTARMRLKTDGLTPVSVKPQSILTKDIQIGGPKKVKARDLSIFCRQFTSILNAGVTVVDALRMLSDQTENKSLRKAIAQTKEYVQQGETLAEAMARNPKVFPEMFVNMVEAGEASGSLDTCVGRMGIQFEKSAKLSGLIKKAMIYPIALLSIALIVTIVMSVAVVPKFAEMFSTMGSELPAATKLIMAFSDFLIHKWYILIAIVAALVIAIKLFKKTEQGKVFFGTMTTKAPIIGKVSLKSNAAKFSRTLSTLISSGMPITAAIDITAKSMQNILFKRALAKARTDVEQGIPLSVPIRKSAVFPSMVHNMLSIGEETGNMESMLDKVAEYYEEETELATGSMAEMLQPVIIVVLGVIVGTLVLAMYQPMISMYGDIGNL